MGVIVNWDSELGKEMLKWEMFPVRTASGEVLAPGNPYDPNRLYPKMLYKAQPFRNGKTLCFAPAVSPFGWNDPNQYQQALLEAETFTKSCQRLVKDEGEHAIAKGQGWCVTAAEALEQAEAEHKAISNAAAEAAFHAQRMTDKARAEFEAASDATDEHVTDLVGARIKKGK